MTAGCDDVRRASDDSLTGIPASRDLQSDLNDIAQAVDEAILGGPVLVTGDRKLHALSDFGGLYIRHRGALMVHARRFLSEPHDIDDVVQETFLKLFLAMPEVETEGQALAFARRVLTNLCIDRYRAARRRPATVDIDLTSADYLLADDEPADPVVQAEDAAVIREALARLSPLHREALIKREIEEKPLPVIAEELGIPEESVKHLLFRARRMLRRLLVGTSVDPAAPMTAPEVLAAANQRLARAALRSTNVIVALLVAVVAVAGGLHGMRKGSPAKTITDGGTVGALPSLPGHYPGLPPRRGSTHHSPHPQAARHSETQVAAPAVSHPEHPPARGSDGHKPAAPSRPASAKPSASATAALARSLRGHFVVQAPDLGDVSDASLQTTDVGTEADGTQTNTSNLTAETGAGALTLGQLVQMSPDGVVSANLTPSVPLADGTVATVTQSSTVSTLPAPGGDTVINVQLVVVAPSQPGASTASASDADAASAPGSAVVTLQALFAPDVAQALGEQVVVSVPSAQDSDSTTGANGMANAPSNPPADNREPAGSRRQDAGS